MPTPPDLREKSRALSDRLIAIRRDLHENPELSFKEFRTAEMVARTLRDLGLEVKEKVGQTGVTALLKGGRPGPTIALRGDIDALPVCEEAAVPYKSKINGVMHACGHDTHTACALGAAMLLAEVKDELEGNVFFIFEPAEEINRGAAALLAEGVMDDPKVDMIFGIHCHPEVPAGKMGVKEGYLMAAVDTTRFKITGKGGHGGLPHRDIDPIVAAASVIMNVQTIVSRNVPPLNPAVVSFGSIHGGQANNVIPDYVELSGTVRTYDNETRDLIEKRLREVVETTAAALGCKGELSYEREFSAVNNDPRATELARAAVEQIGGEGTSVVPTPSTGGEDFAMYLEKAPGCFLWLGIGNPEIGAMHPWHSPLFVADDSCLWLGAGSMAQAAVNAMAALKTV
ncbi:M20 family metallopeptidase [Deltaproteobacteria bacterium OttesenSCG-928-K17]|nr:M20 family metallopeptidase [Deltaproteobacteria bacterium OttesenSCG-928-K17]